MYDDVLLILHPWVAPAFSSVVEPEWSSRRISEHVRDEVDRVVGTRRDWRVQYEFAGTDILLGDRADRILISCIPDAALAFEDVFGARRFEIKSSVAAIAGVVSGIDDGSQVSDSATVALGSYGDRCEVSVHSKGALRFSAFLEGSDPDSRPLKLEALLGLSGHRASQVTRILLFGHRPDYLNHPVSPLFPNASVEWLQPSELFAASQRTITDDPVFGPVAAGAFNRLLSHV